MRLDIISRGSPKSSSSVPSLSPSITMIGILQTMYVMSWRKSWWLMLSHERCCTSLNVDAIDQSDSSAWTFALRYNSSRIWYWAFDQSEYPPVLVPRNQQVKTHHRSLSTFLTSSPSGEHQLRKSAWPKSRRWQNQRHHQFQSVVINRRRQLKLRKFQAWRPVQQNHPSMQSLTTPVFEFTLMTSLTQHTLASQPQFLSKISSKTPSQTSKPISSLQPPPSNLIISAHLPAQ